MSWQTIGTAADLTALQQTVRAQTIALDAAVQAAVTSGQLPATDPTNVAWSAMAQRAQSFYSETPAWLPFSLSSQIDAGVALQRDLLPWYDTLAGKGISVPAKPVAAPAASNPISDVASGFSKLVDALPLLLIGLVVFEVSKGKR